MSSDAGKPVSIAAQFTDTEDGIVFSRPSIGLKEKVSVDAGRYDVLLRLLPDGVQFCSKYLMPVERSCDVVVTVHRPTGMSKPEGRLESGSEFRGHLLSVLSASPGYCGGISNPIGAVRGHIAAAVGDQSKMSLGVGARAGSS